MNRSEIEASRIEYRERVLPGVSLFLVLLAIAPSISVVMWPVSPLVAVVAGIASSFTAVMIAIATSPVIEVFSSGEHKLLCVKGARISSQYIENARVIDKAKHSFEKGPGLNARAFAAFQIGAGDLVKVMLNDSNDPVPYWLFSSRNGARIVAILENGKI